MSRKIERQALTSAAEKAQLSLSQEQIDDLVAGRDVPYNAEIQALARGNCRGIKITDLGGGCGLYLTWNGGPMISVCCETP